MSGVRQPLLRWYRKHRRDLPWRRTRDPYAIWISEAMLQQTRVETVIPYYERFLGRFPDVASLARADLDDVLGVWSGLGYYSRARNLKRAAEEVVARFDGRIPDRPEALRSLPGVGPYTAGAVASIAFDRPEPVLDGNVTRVLARLLGLREDVGRPATRKRLLAEAAGLARGPHPGDLNQALMELGARVCTPRRPDCPACPVARGCVARREGRVDRIPAKRGRVEPRLLRAAAALLERRGRLLAVQRPGRGLLGGLWELPGVALRARQRAGPVLTSGLRDSLGLEVDGLERVGRLRQLFTHRALDLELFRGRVAGGRVRRNGYAAHRWVSPAALSTLPQATATRRALAVALGSERGGGD